MPRDGMYFDCVSKSGTLNQRGFIDKRIWQVWKSGMGTAFSKSAFHKLGHGSRSTPRFGQDFGELC